MIVPWAGAELSCQCMPLCHHKHISTARKEITRAIAQHAACELHKYPETQIPRSQIKIRINIEMTQDEAGPSEAPRTKAAHRKQQGDNAAKAADCMIAAAAKHWAKTDTAISALHQVSLQETNHSRLICWRTHENST